MVSCSSCLVSDELCVLRLVVYLVMSKVVLMLFLLWIRFGVMVYLIVFL